MLNVELILAIGVRMLSDVLIVKVNTEDFIRINGEANVIGGIGKNVIVETAVKTSPICQTERRGAESAENHIFMLT